MFKIKFKFKIKNQVQVEFVLQRSHSFLRAQVTWACKARPGASRLCRRVPTGLQVQIQNITYSLSGVRQVVRSIFGHITYSLSGVRQVTRSIFGHITYSLAELAGHQVNILHCTYRLAGVRQVTRSIFCIAHTAWLGLGRSLGQYSGTSLTAWLGLGRSQGQYSA
ncbi:hypothetical protein BsWGS_27569 [Bradybaena similaris]